jgi:Resolvase, N terminal domain
MVFAGLRIQGDIRNYTDSKGQNVGREMYQDALHMIIFLQSGLALASLSLSLYPAIRLRTVLTFLRMGDVLMVTRIDRLARSIGDLQDTVRAVRAKGASLKATEQAIATGTAAGKCFLDMLGVFAEFETNLRRERQLEGIAKAKAAGVYKGRPASIDAAQVRAMKAQGIGASEIAKALKIGRASAIGRWKLVEQPPRWTARQRAL